MIWRGLFKWLRDPGGMSYPLAQLDALEERLLTLLADLWYRGRFRQPSTEPDMKVTRMLLSRNHVVTITGTERQIRAAAERMARRTRSCVTIAIAVGHYHRRGCEERPAGGYDAVGN